MNHSLIDRQSGKSACNRAFCLRAEHFLSLGYPNHNVAVAPDFAFRLVYGTGFYDSIDVHQLSKDETGTMERFNSLELLYKGTLLKKNAHYLMLTLYQHYTVRLYSWDRFFIEQYYDNERGHTTRITIANANDINKFMKDISIADLGLSTTQ